MVSMVGWLVNAKGRWRDNNDTVIADRVVSADRHSSKKEQNKNQITFTKSGE